MARMIVRRDDTQGGILKHSQTQNIKSCVKEKQKLRFEMHDSKTENGSMQHFDQLQLPQTHKVETEVTIEQKNSRKRFREIVTKKITSKMSSFIDSASANGSPKRRQTIFDFSAKEKQKMNDEVKVAMRKMPVKKAKIRIDIPEINQDHSNIVYGLVAVFSGLVFWILPAFYTRYALPYLFEELAPLYEST